MDLAIQLLERHKTAELTRPDVHKSAEWCLEVGQYRLPNPSMRLCLWFSKDSRYSLLLGSQCRALLQTAVRAIAYPSLPTQQPQVPFKRWESFLLARLRLIFSVSMQNAAGCGT